MSIGMLTRIYPLLAAMLILATLQSGMPASHASAWEKDTHYYLTYYLAVATCFEPPEAIAIASGDQSVDLDNDVYPIPTARDLLHMDLTRYRNALRRFHSMGPQSEVDARLARTKARVHGDLSTHGATYEALVSYGIYLHALQDSYSHVGYNTIIGHAHVSLYFKDPDSLATNPQKSKAMAQATVKDMLEVCDLLGRQPRYIASPKDPALDSLMDAMIKGSNPYWKNRMYKKVYYGGFRDPYHDTIKHMKNLVESALRSLPFQTVTYIPPITSVDLDRNANIVKDANGNVKAKGQTSDPSDTSVLVTDYHVYMDGATLSAVVDIEVFNMGDNRTSGNLTIAAAVFDRNDNAYGIVAFDDVYLGTGERRSYRLDLTVQVDADRNLTADPLYLLITVEGGPEDPGYYNNYAIIPISDEAFSGGTGGNVTFTTTYTTLYTTVYTYTSTYSTVLTSGQTTESGSDTTGKAEPTDTTTSGIAVLLDNRLLALIILALLLLIAVRLMK